VFSIISLWRLVDTENWISNKSIDQTNMNINSFNKNTLDKVRLPLEVEGGKVFVNRLVHLFGLRNKVGLSEFIGVSTGSLATWQTRGTLPFELVIRIHLATGVSIEYLLFDELKGDLNVMQYLPDPTLQPNYANIKINISKFRYSLTTPAHYDGGSVLIERLVSLFKVPSKVELGDLFGVTIGTLSTWHTRKTTPHELLCRIHLATGVSMHFLCFGKEWEDVVALRDKAKKSVTQSLAGGFSSETMKNPNFGLFADNSDNASINVSDVTAHYSIPEVMLYKSDVYSIEGGSKLKSGAYQSNEILWEHIGVSPNNVLVIRHNQATYFVNPEINTVTKGLYLFTINDVHQIGELKQLPDGQVYLIDENDKYQINQETTEVIGKVVSILKNI
jgi:hypothetical protein